MEKAKIAILDDKGREQQSIDVQFNPSDYQTTHSARYSDGKPAVQSANAPQFMAEENSTMKVKLTLDGFTKAGVTDPEKASDVLSDLKFFRALVIIDEAQHKPPLCTFSWGSFSFRGFAEQLSINYAMFASSGKPIRAVVDLSLKSADDKKVAYQSPDRTKRRVLTQDTPMYMTAFDAYNDPAQWRRIAVANGIRNPRRLKPGIVLKIPPMEDDGL